MTPPIYGLFLTCLFLDSLAHTTSSQQSILNFEPADVGGSVTLQCLCQDDVSVLYYWYKQTLGQKPKLVSSFYKHNNLGTFYNEFHNNPRFSLDNTNLRNHLKISDLQPSDSATYYCMKSNLYDFKFCEGTTVEVMGSGSNIPAVVHQAVSETINPGGSVTLNCTVRTGTCNGSHSVYWFKDSGKSEPGIIYTNEDRNNQCEKKTETQTNTCLYNLPTDKLNHSMAGTYYCAVASCGHILFGNGTKLGNEENQSSLLLVYFLSGALIFTTLLVVSLALTLYRMYKGNYTCTGSNVTFSATSTENTEDEDNLHYTALKNHKFNRSGKQGDERIQTECVYSSVKQ